MRRLLCTSLAMVFGASAPAQQAELEPLACTPALPFYCENIHVGCAGRSELATLPFRVTPTETGAEVTADGQEAVPARVARDRSGFVLRLDSSRDWIRIEGDGRYSTRIYRDDVALMTRGACAASDPS